MKKQSEHVVYVKLIKGYIKLFRLLVFDTDGIPEFKLKDLSSTYCLIKDDNNVYPSQIRVGQQICYVQDIEFTYHKDGTMFQEIIIDKKNAPKDHQNPYGKFEKTTPINEIKDFQPFLTIDLRNLSEYELSQETEKEKKQKFVHICKNDDLFKSNESFQVLIYLKAHKIPFCRYSTKEIYSNIICNINDTLDVCLYIQKHKFTDYDSIPINSFCFLDKSESIGLMKETLNSHIFDGDFSSYLNDVFGGFAILNEDFLRLQDIIDELFVTKLRDKKIILHKSQFTKYMFVLLNKGIPLFNYLPHKLKIFVVLGLYKSEERKMYYENRKKSYKLYVASSWRNKYYPEVVAKLSGAGYKVYDFRNPPSGDHGFWWDSIDPQYMDWTPNKYKEMLMHPKAMKQFDNDIKAMKSCDACVLVLPCGRSAHTEAGWFAGQGKKVLVYIPEKQEPELMYKLFDGVCCSMDELIEALK